MSVRRRGRLLAGSLCRRRTCLRLLPASLRGRAAAVARRRCPALVELSPVLLLEVLQALQDEQPEHVRPRRVTPLCVEERPDGVDTGERLIVQPDGNMILRRHRVSPYASGRAICGTFTAWLNVDRDVADRGPPVA